MKNTPADNLFELFCLLLSRLRVAYVKSDQMDSTTHTLSSTRLGDFIAEGLSLKRVRRFLHHVQEVEHFVARKATMRLAEVLGNEPHRSSGITSNQPALHSIDLVLSKGRRNPSSSTRPRAERREHLLLDLGVIENDHSRNSL